MTRCQLSVAALLLLAARLSHAEADPERGQALYATRCAVCHSADFNGVGPAHRGVVGRRAGQAAGYAYSPALAASTVVWNDQTLDQWLSNPEAFIAGQRMGINVPEADQRADLIAYLKTLTAKK